jgi:hypothetical protein
VYFLSVFLRFAPAFKNKAFSEEQEWRLVSPATHADNPQIDCRATRDLLIPYFKFDLARAHKTDIEGCRILSIARLVCGPGQDHKKALNAVNILLSRKNVRWFSVTGSRIPYRTTLS